MVDVVARVLIAVWMIWTAVKVSRLEGLCATHDAEIDALLDAIPSAIEED